MIFFQFIVSIPLSFCQIELFQEELSKIASDEIFEESCLKLQLKLLSSFVDHEFIPEIAIECRQEVIHQQIDEVHNQDQIALESNFIFILFLPILYLSLLVFFFLFLIMTITKLDPIIFFFFRRLC